MPNRIAPTKTQAKMTNRYAKKKRKNIGVCYACDQEAINEMPESTDVEDI